MNQAYWDEIASRYDEEILDAVQNDKNGVIRQSIREHADKTRLAADFGCGIGKSLPLLSRCFSIVDAYDLSNENLELARRKCRRLPNVRYHHRDLSTEDKTSAQADFAVRTPSATMGEAATAWSMDLPSTVPRTKPLN